MKLRVLMWPINPVRTEASSRPAGPSEWFSGTLQLRGAAEESGGGGDKIVSPTLSFNYPGSLWQRAH